MHEWRLNDGIPKIDIKIESESAFDYRNQLCIKFVGIGQNIRDLITGLSNG